MTRTEGYEETAEDADAELEEWVHIRQADAVAAERCRIADAVRGLRQRHFDHVGGPEVQLAAILAAVEAG